MVPPDLPIGLILEKTQVFNTVVDQLRLIGIDQEIFVIQIGDNAQYPAETFASYQLIDAEELGKHGPDFEPFYVVDVRSTEEWQEGHIPGSHHFELTSLKDSCGQLPKNRPIVLLCRSGQRASLAASWLLKCGFSDVINLRGGMQAWKLAGLPVTRRLN